MTANFLHTARRYSQQSVQPRKRSGRVGITRGFALLLLLASSLFFYVLTDIVFAAEGTEPGRVAEVTVQAGDTLWKLAASHRPDGVIDLRDLIVEIQELNQLKDPLIYPGQTIKIPLE
ncbi:LysM peptidoglycan-binding domain-containing protein [Brevibacillus fulvus]|uniref:LysM repeat protein n=1 Tax=Brevibacillus fulvus TaxID=1125967 RepID=A0A939BUJ0_9BACL|nr:LysM peptidoglycan-binding domain-containing protein [Brevibacillus fulvus]MBM7590509.1 LysM repeat protein [Brevibacillus fulvus]